MAELTAPLVMKNEEKRIVYGPVLIPNEPDTDDDVVTEEQIETVAHKFIEEYGNIDLMHSLNNVGRVVESYILPIDLELEHVTVPKGSWMLAVRVTDDDVWKMVKNKELAGFSIMAVQNTEKSKKSKKSKDVSKRVTLAELGEDWIVNAVSLVDEPAVPKAKWIAIKRKDDTTYEDNNIISKIMKKMGFKNNEKKQDKKKSILSDYDVDRLITIKDILNDILGSNSEPEKEYEEGEETMKEEDVVALIDEKLKPIETLLTEIVDALDLTQEDDDELEKKKDIKDEKETSKKDEPDEYDKETKSEKDNSDKDDEKDEKEKDSKKNTAEKFIEEIKKLQKPFSKRITGQDGVTGKSKKIESDRDAFGFKIKK